MSDGMRLKLAISLALALTLGNAGAASLTLFHNNDGESKLTGDAYFGGVAYFVATLEKLRRESVGRDQLTISSGDNFLAGASFNASLASGQPGSRTYFDALALVEIGYDAITIGNHEFDFGPDVLADFIASYNAHGGSAPFLSANLDFSGSTNLQRLVARGSIARSTIVTRGAERYGIIGATTDRLDTVSNPGAVNVGNVLDAIRREVLNLRNQGVNKIILSSHLQSIRNERDFIRQLSGVDVVIAGGGGELLINTGNARDSLAQATGPYPFTVQDADGRNVAVVTSVGEYLYVGRLDVEFDANGDVVSVTGAPVVVDKTVIRPHPSTQANVVDPLLAATAAANAVPIATTDVFLEYSERNTHGPRVIRSRETNLGNLVADAFVWAVRNERAGPNPGNTLIGLQNGGAIREDLDNDEDGVITQGEARAALPFTSTLAVIRNVDANGLAAALENAVSSLPGQGGRFAHVSGIGFDYDPDKPAGNRLVEIRLADGTVVWSHAGGVPFDGKFDIATNSFLAGAGTPDGYDFRAYPKAVLTTGYADALIGFLTQALGGVVSSLDYALAGSQRINAVARPDAPERLLLGGPAGVSPCRQARCD